MPPSGRDAAAHVAPAARAMLTIGPDAPLAAVPRSFFGLSTEYWALPLYAWRMTLFERVLTMLHVPGDGPFVLRVGGDSADHTFWERTAVRLPAWTYSVTPHWLREARTLATVLGVRFIIDLNLVTDNPARAVQLAHAAERALPHHSIIAFEIGNEPDLYRLSNWLKMTDGDMVAGHILPGQMTIAHYVSSFSTYAAALRTVAPGVPLAGPALAMPNVGVDWIRRLIADDRSTLGLVTVHRYPYTACQHRRTAGSYATVTKVLSRQATVAMADSVRTAVRLAHRSGLPLRLTELNSVTCGGVPGVSNTFATALWAPDALFNLLHVGVDAVNLHVRADTINSPFRIDNAGLVARPLLYGLALFVRTLGTQPRTVALHLHAPDTPNLSAWAVRSSNRTLHVLLIDKGVRSVRVALHLPTRGPATVQRLLAHSAYAQSGETLAGQRLGTDARWHGRLVLQTLAPRRDRYVVTVARRSAALITALVRPGALGAAAR